MTPRQQAGVAKMIVEITEEHGCILQIEDTEVTVYEGHGSRGPVRGCKMLPYEECGIAEGLHRDDALCTFPKDHDGACSHGIPRDA